MSYPLYIEASEETLRELDGKFTPVENDRLKYCFQNNKWTIDDVHNFNAKVKISFDYMCREHKRMSELRKVYNREYPTDHKKYFSTVAEMMGKMRSTLSMYKQLMDSFRSKRKGKKKRRVPKGIDPTALHHGAYSKDMFGWETYPNKAVKEMFDNINIFLTLAGKISKEAIAVIDEENKIRSNPDLACPRFERSFQRSVNDNQKLIEMLKAGNFNADHDIVKAMETAEDVRQLIADMFHTLSFTDFNYFSICKAISDGRKVGLTEEESMLFGKENAEKVVCIRTLLDHILELVEQRDDAKGWNGMLKGKFVMHLLYWCGWDGTKNEALLNYVTNRCKGKIGVVKMGAVMAEKRKLSLLDNKEIYEQQEAFNQEMDDFVKLIQVNSKDKVA
ncbi:MAG: hypothetical protein K6A96_13970 [Prevotella sp.]|nr:hypothetical protein [Prevotella sp.]